MADSILDDVSIALINSKKLPISFASIEEIISDEDSSENYYNKVYERPEWPGGASGVTIALGYDLGYANKDKIIKDFKNKISNEMLNVLLSISGITGIAAHDAMIRTRNEILIPWGIALEIFLDNDMPNWIATVQKVLLNTNLLSPDCLGVLVSIAYNRGASFHAAGDRYKEMRAISTDMFMKNFKDIPNQIRSMARLWPSTNGVHSRRLREANLFEKGLNTK